MHCFLGFAVVVGSDCSAMTFYNHSKIQRAKTNSVGKLYSRIMRTFLPLHWYIYRVELYRSGK